MHLLEHELMQPPVVIVEEEDVVSRGDVESDVTGQPVTMEVYLTHDDTGVAVCVACDYCLGVICAAVEDNDQLEVGKGLIQAGVYSLTDAVSAVVRGDDD